MAQPSKSTEQRFLDKVNKTTGCWWWTGTPSQKYGHFYRNGKNHNAHRVSYELFNGPVGALSVLHECDNPRCVNPEHLFLGTQLDNMRDKYAKGRENIKPYPKKLTAEDVLTIRASDLSQSKLGEAFGVHQVTISEIKTRKIWTHI